MRPQMAQSSHSSAAQRSADEVSRQLVEQCLGVLHDRRVRAFGEPGALPLRDGENLEPITQQRDPILANPRAVWLDITLNIVESESATMLMKRAWWP
jgi:hypothetical protein